MANLAAFEQAPTAVNVTVANRPARRPREYLTEKEIEALLEAARANRWGHRDATAILIAYRHGLRASELVALRWDDFDLTTGKVHIRRAKGGQPSVHPIGGKEMRALRRLQRETTVRSPYVLSPTAGYQRMVARAGEAAGFASWCTATCCAIPAAIRLPMTATIPGPSSTTSGTGRSCRRCATSRCRRWLPPRDDRAVS
jgi:integrase